MEDERGNPTSPDPSTRDPEAPEHQERPPFRPLYDLIVDMDGGPSEDQRRKRARDRPRSPAS